MNPVSIILAVLVSLATFGLASLGQKPKPTPEQSGTKTAGLTGCPFEFPCDAGIDRSKWSNPKNVASKFTLGKAPDLIRSDGKGPYVSGTANIVGNINGSAAIVLLDTEVYPQPGAKAWRPPALDPAQRRSFMVDLNNPVKGDIGKRLGVVEASVFGILNVSWKMDSAFVMHSFHDIPVGDKVLAEKVEIGFLVGGVTHLLQIGPEQTGSPYTGGTAVYGTGTSQAKIYREDTNRWVVELPQKSVGRLFDVHLGMSKAVNRGLYYTSGHIVIESQSR